jgi:hypothetical protein
MRYRLTSEHDEDASDLKTIVDDLGLTHEEELRLAAATPGAIVTIKVDNEPDMTHEILVLDGTTEPEPITTDADAEGD